MKNIGGAFARSVARAYCGENSLVSSRGRKLDFVREDVPNVRSPDLLFLYLSRATSPKTPLLRLSFQPSPHCVFFLPPSLLSLFFHTSCLLLSARSFSSTCNSFSSSCRDSSFPRDTRRRRDAPPRSAVLCIFHRFLWNSF